MFKKAGMSSFPLLHSIPCILAFMDFMIQPLSEADHICQTLQVHFDKMICNVLEKCHLLPGLTLLLGGIFHYMSPIRQGYHAGVGLAASSYLIQQWGKGHILYDIGFFGGRGIISHTNGAYLLPGTQEFFRYLTMLLKSPEQSETHIFDQKRYVTAAKECLQLYLCNHHKFSKGATEFTHHDKMLRRSKPWEWVARQRVHRRIGRKGWRHFKALWYLSLHASDIIYQGQSFPKNSPEHQFFQFLSYQWALDLLPFLLEKSAVSLELADVLHCCTFAMMAWEFPRRMQLAKKAIRKYLLWVESAGGNP